MYKMASSGQLHFVLLASCILVVTSFIIGGATMRYYIRKEAIYNGAAHYKVDPFTGETTFVWSGY